MPIPSVDPSTPGSDVINRHIRSTSARATPGQSPRLRSDGSVNDNIPRKLNLSPGGQEEESVALPRQQQEPQLLRLPPSLFPHWCILMLCSALCLAAAAGGTPLTTNSSTAENDSETGYYENLQMVMAIATLSLMLSFLAAACYVLVPAAFVGSLYEVTVIGLNIVLQGGNLPIVMNPANDLAVKGSSIVNGNLFVLSWISFLMSWALLKLVLEQAFCRDQARSGNLVYLTAANDGYPPLIPITPYRMAHLSLVLSSLVVLVAATRAYQQQLCSEWNRQLCKRLLFSISVAVMSLLGLVISWSIYFYRLYYRANESPSIFIPSTRVQIGLLGLLSLAWFLVTSVGTFGKHGPGHALGNYFFGVWFSLLLSLYLLKKTLRAYAASPLQNWMNENEEQLPKIQQQPRRLRRRKQQQNRIPGLIQEDDPEQESKRPEPIPEDEPVDASATDDLENNSARTPSASSHNLRIVSSASRGRRSPRDPIAISLEGSFENQQDLEQGRFSLRHAHTDQTAEADSEEEDPYVADTTPKHRSPSASSMPGTAHSAASQKSDFYYEQTRPIAKQYSAEVYDDENDDDYDGYNEMSTSIVTTVIDNTSATAERRGNSPGHGDVLIDPDDYSRCY